jgi:hypothetical protein
MFVDVVLAMEVVWVHFFVIDSFHLDCGVEKSIFATTQVSNSSQGLEGLLRLYVDSHRELALRN